MLKIIIGDVLEHEKLMGSVSTILKENLCIFIS